MSGLPKSAVVTGAVVALEPGEARDGTATRPEPAPDRRAQAIQAFVLDQRRLVLREVRREGHEAVVEAREGDTRRQFRFPAEEWEAAHPQQRIEAVAHAWREQVADEERRRRPS